MWHALAISPRNRTIQVHLYTIRINCEVQPNNQAIYIHPQTHVYALELERFLPATGYNYSPISNCGINEYAQCARSHRKDYLVTFPANAMLTGPKVLFVAEQVVYGFAVRQAIVETMKSWYVCEAHLGHHVIEWHADQTVIRFNRCM